MSELLTIKQAAIESSFSESYIRKQIREYKLNKLDFGREVRIERGEFERWILEHTRTLAGSKKGVPSPIKGGLRKAGLQVIEGSTHDNR